MVSVKCFYASIIFTCWEQEDEHPECLDYVLCFTQLLLVSAAGPALSWWQYYFRLFSTLNNVQNKWSKGEQAAKISLVKSEYFTSWDFTFWDGSTFGFPVNCSLQARSAGVFPLSTCDISTHSLLHPVMQVLVMLLCGMSVQCSGINPK